MAEKDKQSSSGTSGSSSSRSQQSGSGAGKQQSASSGSGGRSQQSTQSKDTLGKEPSKDEIRQRDDATAATGEDTPGVERDPSGVLAPAENAPGPEQPEAPTVRAVDMRPRIEPKDRATFVGAIHKRHEDVDVPEDYAVFGVGDGERDEEVVDLDAKPVDVFQLVTTNQNAVIRLDGQSFVLNGEQTRAFMIDAHGALTNVVT